jgi:hypothetical protein
MKSELLACLLLVACSSTTRGTADPRDAGAADAALDATDASDAQAPDAQDASPDAPPLSSRLPEGKYFMSCLPVLALGDVRLAFKFRLEVGAAGLLDVAPLRKDAAKLTDVPASYTPRVIELKNGIATFGDYTLPGAANTLSDSDVRFERMVLTFGTIGANACAELDAVITSPRVIDLNEKGDVCLLRSVTGDDLPVLEKADFNCP